MRISQFERSDKATSWSEIFRQAIL